MFVSGWQQKDPGYQQIPERAAGEELGQVTHHRHAVPHLPHRLHGRGGPCFLLEPSRSTKKSRKEVRWGEVL